MSTLKISRSSGPLLSGAVGPVETGLEVDVASIGLNDTLVESITPPVEGIPWSPEMSDAPFCYFSRLSLSIQKLKMSLM